MATWWSWSGPMRVFGHIYHLSSIASGLQANPFFEQALLRDCVVILQGDHNSWGDFSRDTPDIALPTCVKNEGARTKKIWPLIQQALSRKQHVSSAASLAMISALIYALVPEVGSARRYACPFELVRLEGRWGDEGFINVWSASNKHIRMFMKFQAIGIHNTQQRMKVCSLGRLVSSCKYLDRSQHSRRSSPTQLREQEWQRKSWTAVRQMASRFWSRVEVSAV